jgi:hypothetical protein
VPPSGHSATPRWSAASNCAPSKFGFAGGAWFDSGGVTRSDSIHAARDALMLTIHDASPRKIEKAF